MLLCFTMMICRITVVVLLFVPANISCKCSYLRRDLTLEKYGLDGLLLFQETFTDELDCWKFCSLNESCVVVSYNKYSGSCTGFQPHTISDADSLQNIPVPIFHKGIDRLYITYGSMTLLILQQSATYEEAKQICFALNGRLTKMNSEDKVTDSRKLTKDRVYKFWMGATDIAKEGTWLWENGNTFNKPVNLDVKLNNAHAAYKSDPYNADCAAFLPDPKAMQDYHCKSTCPIVCERYP